MIMFAIPALASIVELVIWTTATTIVTKAASDIYDAAVAPKEAKPD